LQASGAKSPHLGVGENDVIVREEKATTPSDSGSHLPRRETSGEEILGATQNFSDR
jgi:hypothetical protein